MSTSPVLPAFRANLRVSPRRLASLALLLAAGGMGCYRATGVARPAVAVEEIPAGLANPITGLKATAGPGDFYLGNDQVHMAVDGAVFGDREGQFGAASGGGILDIGTIALDQNFHRVSQPTDMLERLGPVVNQDPDLPLVFDRFDPTNAGGTTILEMRGYLLDPLGKLGASTDTQHRVAGVTVLHRIVLNKNETFYTLQTTLTNGGSAPLPIRNLGDFLSQHGGGYRFNVPAVADFSGAPISSWGLDIPGSDFANPLLTSVAAPMVAMTGAESGGDTLDAHSSIGIMPVDGNSLLITSDPQASLTEGRPSVPSRLVVGSPAVPSLAPGDALTYARRLYVVGGTSFSVILPSQGTTLFNEMAQARAGIRGEDVGILSYNTFGTAIRGGARQTEFKFERYTYTGTPAPGPWDPTNPARPEGQPQNWLLERVESREPFDITNSNAYTGIVLPAIPDGTTGSTQRYRITTRNGSPQSSTMYLATNSVDPNASLLALPITPSKSQYWFLSEALAPERDEVVDASGNLTRSKVTTQYFTSRQSATSEYGGLNPLRLTFLGVGVPDPQMQRVRMLSSVYSEIYKTKVAVTGNQGSYHYTAGNQVFGTGFGATASPATMYLAPGDYLVHATRGPLSRMDSVPVKAFDGQTDTKHEFVTTPPVLPAGWTSFDLPAPTQATTGGLNPGEMLSSALAEGVQVVVRTEEDRHTDATALRAEFRSEIDTPFLSDIQRAPVGLDPFVISARSTQLSDGFTTALFTPAPDASLLGGVRPSKGWTLADFIAQAEGSYTVVHRPRGPQGLFTVRHFDPAVPLGTAPNGWWTATGVASMGKRNGDFDALELLRAEGCDPADPTAWYAEFSTVRSDWFALLNQQGPGAFTKGLGLSAARFSFDTPVGLARTYLKVNASLDQSALDPVLGALRSGAAVASTGPMLEVSVGGVGPGGLVAGPVSSVDVTINLYAPDWVPVDEVRVVVNGGAPIQVPLSSFTASATDFRLRTATVTVPMPATGKDAWVVVEAGVPRNQTGPYQTLPAPTPWNRIMKGIYPIAITNPIFVDVNGGGYTPPGL